MEGGLRHRMKSNILKHADEKSIKFNLSLATHP